VTLTTERTDPRTLQYEARAPKGSSAGFSDSLAIFMAVLNSHSIVWLGWSWLVRERDREVVVMLDLLFVLATVAFFVVSIGYIVGCERLK
jgi:hypothetical protein